MRWRTKIVLDLDFVVKSRCVRVIHQHPQNAGQQKWCSHRQLRLHRFRFGRAGIEIVRHGDNGKQNADDTQQGQQSNARPARAVAGETRPRPEKQQRGRKASPNDIENEFQNGLLKLRIR